MQIGLRLEPYPFALTNLRSFSWEAQLLAHLLRPNACLRYPHCS